VEFDFSVLHMLLVLFLFGCPLLSRLSLGPKKSIRSRCDRWIGFFMVVSHAFVFLSTKNEKKLKRSGHVFLGGCALPCITTYFTFV